MAKITAEEQKDLLTFPKDSILSLKVDEVETKELQGSNGPWTKLGIKFKILGIQAIGDGSPVEAYESMITEHIFGSIPFRLTDGKENRLRLWAEAILGVEVGIGFELDTDFFLRRMVRGVTGTYQKKTTNPMTGQPFIGHQIEALLPANASATGQSQFAPAQYAPQQMVDPGQLVAQSAPGDPWNPTGQQPVAQPANDPWATPAGGWDEPGF